MSNDILSARLNLSKGNQQESPVYADFSVLLSDSFSAPTILVNFNNTLDTSARDNESEQQWVTLRRDSASGEYKARLELSPYSPSAVYQFNALQATDINGRNLFIEQSNEFIRLGLNETRYSFVNPFADNTAPLLRSVSFGQWTKTETGEFAVDINFKMKDDLSGIGYSNNVSNGEGQYVDYNNPSSGRSFSIFLNGPSDFSGIATIADQPDANGDYSGTGRVVMSKYAPSGNYILQLRVPDRAGNTSWGDRYLMGSPASITLNNPQQDVSAPTLSGFALTGSFDAITGRPVISLKGKLSDDISGVQLAWLNLEGPDGSRTITNGGVNQDANGQFDTYIALPIPFTSGRYIVSGSAVDNARNDVWWSKLTELSIVAPSIESPNGAILQGTDASEFVFGSTGNDVINAGGGSDVVICGSGNDTAQGGAGNDAVNGGTGNDFIDGDAGNDTLEGGVGNDNMAGGLGSDTYVIDSMNDVVTEDSGTTNGVDLVQASVSYTISDADVENLSLTGSAAVNATGNGSANTLIGNSANNVLNGGGGVDTANYSGATVGVSVNLATGTASSTATGTDTLVAIENVTTGTGADTLIGNAAANTFNGGNGNDNLNGGTGNDSLIGGAGIDTAVYSTATAAVTVDLINNRASGGLGTDTLNSIESAVGGSAADSMIGNSAANTFNGGGGNDNLNGGLGKDSLTGSTGVDKFIYKSIADSGVGSAVRDVITDFQGGSGEKIDLSVIDAYAPATGNQAFTYIGSNAFTGTKGEARFSGGVLQMNTGTDKSADMGIALTGVTTFSSTFLVL